MRQMRIIVESAFQDGALNMALDCAIAEAVARRAQLPTLRLYGWQPFCLSLGYGQRAREAKAAALEARGWHLLRRPTGGKAILHGDELTYSLSLPLDHALASGDIVESYRRLSAGLLRGLRCLGLQAKAERGAANGLTGPVCFAQPSHYEIMVGGRKLIGSAQLRRKDVMLQHGTLPLFGDVARICDGLVFESAAARAEEKRRVRQQALSLDQALGRQVAWAEVAAAICCGFEEEFDLQLLPLPLSAAESQRAAELRRDRFANSEWTYKR